jgi:hypothetical protein
LVERFVWGVDTVVASWEGRSTVDAAEMACAVITD